MSQILIASLQMWLFLCLFAHIVQFCFYFFVILNIISYYFLLLTPASRDYSPFWSERGLQSSTEHATFIHVERGGVKPMKYGRGSRCKPIPHRNEHGRVGLTRKGGGVWKEGLSLQVDGG